ncbi:MAG: hypothetical protein QOI61_453 [Actinomycetota bacterium]
MTATGPVWDRPREGWTCQECAFSFDATEPTAVTESIAKTGKRLRAPLTRGLKDEDLDAVLRTRPEPDQWSALEYACHIRDVLELNVERFEALAASDGAPEFVGLNPDQAVIDRDYNAQDPAVVADRIDALAAELAAAMTRVPADGWQRFGTRGELVFTLDWMARNVQHEVDHHLLDIGRTMRHVRGR